jgi:hypothetical protein
VFCFIGPGYLCASILAASKETQETETDGDWGGSRRAGIMGAILADATGNPLIKSWPRCLIFHG